MCHRFFETDVTFKSYTYTFKKLLTLSKSNFPLKVETTHHKRPFWCSGFLQQKNFYGSIID